MVVLNIVWIVVLLFVNIFVLILKKFFVIRLIRIKDKLVVKVLLVCFLV